MASSDREHLDSLFRAIYAVIRRIPRGRVATYGQVAELAGIPRGGRISAAALKTMKPSMHLPWQRVIGKAGTRRGRIAIHDPVGAAMQRHLLEHEGVDVGDRGLVALDVYGWSPSDARAKPRRVTAAFTVGSSRAASPRRRPRSASTRRASSSRR
jgi:methylated-DNA-protein-cysteine methyltransferase-like protein|nr:MGMT family protein [Kofleriaceae bacterium]